MPDTTADDSIAAWLTAPDATQPPADLERGPVAANRVGPDLAELRRLRDTEREEFTTPPPVTVYGVRFSDGDIEWCADRDDAIDLRDGCDEPGAHLVTVTGHVRPA